MAVRVHRRNRLHGVPGGFLANRVGGVMTMDAKTETALRESIAKWQENARAETLATVHLRQEDCPLCLMHHHDFGGQGNCKGCPISARTGHPNCHGSPYDDAFSAYFGWSPDNANAAKQKARFHTAAKDMADFLASLLPEGKQ